MSNFVTPSIADDAERGRQLAERWCTSCHVVVDDVPGGTIGPAFEVVVPLRGRSDAQLKAWLALPHEPMPDFGLSAREINDIVAYIALVGQR
ncbi:UNVERIFIED_CONTAM: hypothetical protein GTU68_046519 [Idotea baltica]|nr:hypothetical protein [Idotea baltica]